MTDEKVFELQLMSLNLDGNNIKFISNPTTDQILIALENSDGEAIRHISNPDYDIQERAVRINGQNLRYITNPTDDLKFLSIEQNGSNIMYIGTPTEEMQLLAVRSNPSNIRLIRNPTEKVQLTAVEKSSRVIKFITNPSVEVQRLAIQKEGYEFYDVYRVCNINIYEENQRLFIEQYPNIAHAIKNPSQETKRYMSRQKMKEYTFGAFIALCVLFIGGLERYGYM